MRGHLVHKAKTGRSTMIRRRIIYQVYIGSLVGSCPRRVCYSPIFTPCSGICDGRVYETSEE
ncbi:hypothetical protein BD311DRAFT_745391 [Dichomitus squalens]|uniref:Uncharacterized protein n=1 Tax=Dichomitus squalens TaxID=114155 RepID=A0A4V2K226_9APHY|nr:hypothetical protein BD311DRAFT_745391 [Dichomitus squalens]